MSDQRFYKQLVKKTDERFDDHLARLSEKKMSKGPILQKIWDNLPKDEKKLVKARAAELKAEYLSLQEVRKEAGLTQANVSKKMDIDQARISRIEKI
ncbi:MAG: helix-turn-helix domain-containing protein [Candidatus Moranbacteria bacterium]|nr:helix-turn-helix domain-containing protein [Candidatus Moranbacteria bacterium]